MQAILLQACLHLLLAMSVHCQGCGRISNTKSSAFPLNRSDIRQTWQSECDECLKWSCSKSGSDECKARVTFPNVMPRWLVIQLWQPILLRDVSASSEASWNIIDAFSAATLPMELLLQHPCRADRQLFESSNGWRKVVETEDAGAISFILLNNTRSQKWNSLHLHGNWLGISWFDRIHIKRSISNGTIGCSVETVLFSCADASFNCGLRSPTDAVLRNASARRHSVTHHNGANAFKVSLTLSSSGSVRLGFLYCCPTNKVGGSLCARASLQFSNRLTNIAVSPVLVYGRSVTVSIALKDPKWQASDSCQVISVGGRARDFENEYATVSRVKSTSGYVIREDVTFETNITNGMLNSVIKCKILQVNRADMEIREDHNFRLFPITPAISKKQCLTDVDLGTSRNWLVGEVREIRVTSRRCSVRNAVHTCWLQDAGRKFSELLGKVQQSSLNSTHQLSVRQWMVGRRDWLVRCLVNQSGIADSYAESQKGPEVMQDSPIQVPLIPTIAVSAGVCLCVAVVTFAVTFASSKNRGQTPRQQQRRSNRLPKRPLPTPAFRLRKVQQEPAETAKDETADNEPYEDISIDNQTAGTDYGAGEARNPSYLGGNASTGTYVT